MSDDIKAVRDKLFRQIAEGWKEHGFHNGYFTRFDEDRNPELIPAFNLLKSEGLIKQHGGGYGCVLTSLGQQEARELLGL